MSFRRFAEEKIQNAIANGEFENLRGEGQSIDLTAYFNTPSKYRVGHSLLKANKFVPEEVDILRDIAYLKEKISGGEYRASTESLKKDLREKELALAILIERNKRHRK